MNHFLPYLLQLEPISPVSPKLNKGDHFSDLRGYLNETINILCPAMGWPRPIFK